MIRRHLDCATAAAATEEAGGGGGGGGGGAAEGQFRVDGDERGRGASRARIPTMSGGRSEGKGTRVAGGLRAVIYSISASDGVVRGFVFLVEERGGAWVVGWKGGAGDYM